MILVRLHFLHKLVNLYLFEWLKSSQAKLLTLTHDHFMKYGPV